MAGIILDRWLGSRFAGLREIVEEQSEKKNERDG